MHFLPILTFGRAQQIASEAGHYMGFSHDIEIIS